MMNQENTLKGGSKKNLIVGGVIVGVLVLIGISTASSNPQNTQQQPAKQEVAQTQPTPTPQQYQYKVLSRVENKTVENVELLVQSGEANAQAIAMEVKGTCKKPCNIYVYDDQKAYDLESQYNKMMGDLSTQPSDLQTWKKTNYVYVAEHLVGSIDFETGAFDDFPYKDWYYKELKGQK